MCNNLLTLDPALLQELAECDRIYKENCDKLKSRPEYKVDWQLVDSAWEIAKQLRPDTRRKSGVLYLRHPCSVMAELAELNCNSHVLAAALLHDTIKDGNLSHREIFDGFGKEVAQIISAVAAIKKADADACELFSRLSEKEKQDTLHKHILPKLSGFSYLREGFLVFFADRADNLKSLYHCDTVKRQICVESTRFVAIPAALHMREAYFAQLLQELCHHQEVLECDRGYENICKTIKKQPGYVVDWQLVDKAWETAKKLHSDTRRKSGELYIYHPRSVMEEVAKLRCKSSVLAAALLHDTMEDCSMTYEALREGFSYEVAQIVSAVTDIKEEEKKAEARYSTMSDQEKRQFAERFTDAKLVAAPFQREAFLIRFADRAHNLQTIEACGTGQRLQKIHSSRAFLIPAAQKLGMRYFEVILNEWCMRFEGVDFENNEWADILKKRNGLTKFSGKAYSQFDQMLQDAIAEQTIFSFPAFNPYARLRGISKDGGDGVRMPGRRVMLAYELKQQWDPNTPFERSRLDLWEIILTCKDRDMHDMLEKFLAIYCEHLEDEGIFIEYVGREGDGLIVRLSDSVENNYRVVLIPESRLEAYFIGEHRGERLTMIEEEAPGDALRPQITVYSYSPQKGYREHKKCVPYGATALDFAFIVHKELGLTVKGARIHKWRGDDTTKFTEKDYKYPPGTVLSEGDVVYFDADYERDGEVLVYSKPNVSFDSMLDVNTQYGKTCLIHYFKEKYKDME